MTEKIQNQTEEMKELPFYKQIEGRFFSELTEVDKKLPEQLKGAIVQVGVIRPRKQGKGKWIIEKVSLNISAEQLARKIENGEINLPIFQRGKVWDIKKKSELIYTLLTVGVIPEIIVYEDKEGEQHLIDGWQRSSTITDFLNNRFKLKFDPNVEHLDPKNADEQQLLKNIFERINYKSTPLSKYRIVILTIYTLSDTGKREREKLERKIALIQETARRIKEEDRQENNLGFALRVLTGIRTYQMMETEKEKLEEIKAELKSKNYTDYVIEILREWIKEIDENLLTNILERTYDLAYIVTKGKVSPIASPQGQRNAEAIALVLYEMMKKQADGKPLIEKDLLEGDVDTDKLQEIIELLKAEEDEALQRTGRKNPTATKDYRMYLTATEALFKIKDLIKWEEILPNIKVEEITAEAEPEEDKKSQSEGKEVKEEQKPEEKTENEQKEESENGKKSQRKQETETKKQEENPEEKKDGKDKSQNFDFFNNL
jgi:flagellar biosynthesis regulator FlaF